VEILNSSGILYVYVCKLEGVAQIERCVAQSATYKN
jgi:hypothetical protein